MSFKVKAFQLIVVIFLLVLSACNAQTNKKLNLVVGGGCEGCEAIYEYGNIKLNAIDTLPGFQETEPKLRITGTVYEKDGKTPAEDVILYIYHTNRKGIYETKGNEKGWAKRHGFIRGWVKTDETGQYTFYTFRPATYPDRSEPEHIHLTVKEPDKNEYYLDSYVFDDDPLLTTEQRNKLANRGSSGITEPIVNEGLLTIRRDIILGLNVPGYNN